MMTMETIMMTSKTNHAVDVINVDGELILLQTMIMMMADTIDNEYVDDKIKMMIMLWRWRRMLIDS